MSVPACDVCGDVKRRRREIAEWERSTYAGWVKVVCSSCIRARDLREHYRATKVHPRQKGQVSRG